MSVAAVRGARYAGGMRHVIFAILAILALTIAACGPSVRHDADASGPLPPDGPTGDCSAPAQRCAGDVYQTCGVDERWHDDSICQFPYFCHEALGCISCAPGQPTCVGDEVRTCNPDGTVGDLVSTCALESCSGGVCQDACGMAAQKRSYIGCEYWPVDLNNNSDIFGEPIPVPGSECAVYAGTETAAFMTVQTIDVCPGPYQGNHSGFCGYGGDCSDAGGGVCSARTLCVLDAQHGPFAVVVSNPDELDDAHVTLALKDGTATTVTVAPGAVEIIWPQKVGFVDQSLLHSGIEDKAYRLTSDRPIVAYQFNPLENVGVFSNDASLLLPAHTYDTKYLVATWPSLERRPVRHDSNGYVTIVAARTGVTTVTVTPTAAVRPGNGVAAIPAGATRSFTLTQWQTLTLEAVANGDLTGTLVESDLPVGVFAGHQATQIARDAAAPCCMDHLEDQLFPTSAWGKVYAVARSQSRGTGEPDILRVVAQKPGTTITFDPPVATCPTLGPGQHCQLAVDGDVVITANEPILVAHYLVSTGGIASDSGDPAMSFAVPTEQQRLDYTFLVPPDYNFNWISVAAPTGGAVVLDGVDVTGSLTPIGNGGAWLGGRIAVTEGQRKLVCPLGCGVEVYGYSDAVSYLYAAGLDLREIVVE